MPFIGIMMFVRKGQVVLNGHKIYLKRNKNILIIPPRYVIFNHLTRRDNKLLWTMRMLIRLCRQLHSFELELHRLHRYNGKSFIICEFWDTNMVLLRLMLTIADWIIWNVLIVIITVNFHKNRNIRLILFRIFILLVILAMFKVRKFHKISPWWPRNLKNCCMVIALLRVRYIAKHLE